MKFKIGSRGARSITRWAIAASAGAGTVMALSGAALATTTTIGLPFYTQIEDDWCAITEAQEILSYYGSSVQQCEEANLDFGQTDCCNPAYESGSACNPGGSFTGTPLAHYGIHYLQYANNSFSFSQIESEINAGRPVSVAWTFDAGGGHAMNVAGYNTSGSLLLIHDPLPGTACPMGDDPCWMSYTTYMGGTGYTYYSQAPLYDIYWSPVCSSDYFDLPASSMQQCFDTWTHHGTEPVALSATMDSGSVVYSGSFQAVSGGYYQGTGLTGSAYQTLFDNEANAGYRPTVVNVIDAGGAWQYDALFGPAEGAFSSSTGMTASSFNSTNSTLTGEGYVIMDLFGYNDASNNAYFAATWVKTTGSGQTAQIGISSSNYQSVFNSKANAGYYPFRVSAYNSGGSIYYAVIWADTPSGGFYADNGASVSSIESLDSSVGASGYHLSYVSALNNSFSGVFTK